MELYRHSPIRVHGVVLMYAQNLTSNDKVFTLSFMKIRELDQKLLETTDTQA
jgi:hypothetical protein